MGDNLAAAKRAHICYNSERPTIQSFELWGWHVSASVPQRLVHGLPEVVICEVAAKARLVVD